MKKLVLYIVILSLSTVTLFGQKKYTPRMNYAEKQMALKNAQKSSSNKPSRPAKKVYTPKPSYAETQSGRRSLSNRSQRNSRGFFRSLFSGNRRGSVSSTSSTQTKSISGEALGVKGSVVGSRRDSKLTVAVATGQPRHGFSDREVEGGTSSSSKWPISWSWFRLKEKRADFNVRPRINEVHTVKTITVQAVGATE